MPEITLLAHNIRSTHNVGSILRTAEGFGVKEIICSGYTPYPKLPDDNRLPHMVEKLTRQIHKTSLGAETLVSIRYISDIHTWLEINKKTDRKPVYALEQHTGSKNIRSFRPSQSFALLLGEEVHGIAPDLLEWCDEILEIPMHGKKESFNVSVATGIALFSLSDQRI
ncbi:TrmH family RNA methyltransferase [Candidatus Saccharibacteria bacterium]|jgi:23S rRNA (guanosine2251-2'-O)-methyltransferase|nr:TrmH family RNA methyltransferase [Candidatus Saccharibacteria bacterium]